MIGGCSSPTSVFSGLVTGGHDTLTPHRKRRGPRGRGIHGYDGAAGKDDICGFLRPRRAREDGWSEKARTDSGSAGQKTASIKFSPGVIFFPWTGHHCKKLQFRVFL